MTNHLPTLDALETEILVVYLTRLERMRGVKQLRQQYGDAPLIAAARKAKSIILQ